MKRKQRKRKMSAEGGGSAVARLAFTRPGGAHGRRKKARRVERERAIHEQKED